MKKLLFVANLLLISSFVNAQYLISATEIANRNVSTVQLYIDWYGWDATSMSLNGVTSYKITYNTIDVFGEPTVASGALYVPQLTSDTLPLVSYQHGTIFEKIWVPSNDKLVGQGLYFSGNGYITTMPDYLGLGVNPGTHPWCHWESEATASIDLIRAAKEFLNGSLQIWDNNQLFLTGYSEGGHATMAIHKYIKANNLQSEFNVIASAPMSGPYSMSSVQMDGVFDEDSTYYAPSLIACCVDSYQYVYGNLYANCNEFYDPPYDSIIPDWWASGIHWAGEWNELLPNNYYDFVQDSVLNNFLNNPNHPLNVDLRKNDLHNWIPQEPVRMLYCGMDSIAFSENAIMAQDTMNALGAPEVQAIDLDSIGTHETCWLLSYPYALAWFDSLKVEYVSIPLERIDALIAKVEVLEDAGVFNKGQANALIVKLEAAKTSINNGNNNAAINQLNAFINQVNAYMNAGILTTEQGNDLINDANIIIGLLQDNSSSQSGLSGFENESDISGVYNLDQNYPNPFNGTTTIGFTLAETNVTRLTVYNAMGQEVVILFNMEAQADQGYDIEFNGTQLPEGIYFYHLKSGESVNTIKKMILIK